MRITRRMYVTIVYGVTRYASIYFYTKRSLLFLHGSDVYYNGQSAGKGK
jgi:hypothetical protein